MAFLSLRLTGMDKARAVAAGWNANEWAIRVDAVAAPILVQWLRTFIGQFTGLPQADYQTRRAQGRDVDTAFSGRHMVAFGNLIEYFIQTGTRQHIIPGNPLLSFDWKGKHWFLPYVNHPGTRPTEYVNWAAEAFKAPLLAVGRAEAFAMFGLSP